MHRTSRNLAPFLLLFVAGAALAGPERPPLRFGSEFTFSNLKVLLGGNQVLSMFADERARAFGVYAKFAARYCARTKSCKVTIGRDGGKVDQVSLAFANGLEIEAGIDQNVVEFKVSPLTLPQLRQHETLFDEVIFGGMREAGLSPTGLYGSGHVNLDKRAAFGDDVRRYRDFFVDFHNHPGLADGVLDKDPYNARSLAQLPEERRRAFEAIVREVDEGKLSTIAQFERALRKRVYAPSPERGRTSSRELNKGHALWFNKEKFEIRSVRAQKNAGEFTALAELFAARIRYLDELRATGKPVQIMPAVGANHAIQSLSQFYYYVTDAGLPWKTYASMPASAKYSLVPAILGRKATFGDRAECIYWLKSKRADLILDIAFRWSGYK